MALADLENFLTNPVFWIKLSLVTLLLINGALLQRSESTLRRMGATGDETVPAKWKRVRTFSVVSITLWTQRLLPAPFWQMRLEGREMMSTTAAKAQPGASDCANECAIGRRAFITHSAVLAAFAALAACVASGTRRRHPFRRRTIRSTSTTSRARLGRRHCRHQPRQCAARDRADGPVDVPRALPDLRTRAERLANRGTDFNVRYMGRSSRRPDNGRAASAHRTCLPTPRRTTQRRHVDDQLSRTPRSLSSAFLLPAKRQREREDGTDVGKLGPRRSTQRFDGVANDAQPKPRALGAGHRFMRPEKALKEAVAAILGHAKAVVANANDEQRLALVCSTAPSRRSCAVPWRRRRT